MEYLVRRASGLLGHEDDANHPAWQTADVIPITHFHAKSSAHHPEVAARMMYDDAGIYIRFDVSDRYVICKRTNPQESVCKDSCVEAFLQPKPDKGYFNFEVNCGGNILLYYITDPTRFRAEPKGFAEVAPEHLATIRIFHSLPPKLENEIDQPTDWRVWYHVPNALFEAYVGPLEPPARHQWRGNFYKCADESSHPHWASWAPIGEALNFHAPAYFAPIRFEP